MVKYKFLEHTADIAYEVYAASLEALFENAAEAWQDAAVDKYDILNTDKKSMRLQEFSPEELLVNFLNEINFLLFTKKWIFSRIKNIQINKEKNLYRLSAELEGENFSLTKHHIKNEIKAVTFHQVKIEKQKSYLSTKIIFDI